MKSIRNVYATTIPFIALVILLFVSCEGKPSPSAPVQPTTDWAPELSQYRAFVVSQADALIKATKPFVEAIRAGDLEKARKIYPFARQFYERIEPVAESFGDLDPRIDAREKDSIPEQWSGFHKLEKALWVEGKAAGMTATAETLMQDLKLLRAKVEAVDLKIELLITGSIELLNEVSSTKITGEEELYSHTDLYDFAANVEGAEAIFRILRDKLQKTDAKLEEQIDQRFKALFAALVPFRHGADYDDYRKLTNVDTRRLSQAVDSLAEPLSKLSVVIADDRH